MVYNIIITIAQVWSLSYKMLVYMCIATYIDTALSIHHLEPNWAHMCVFSYIGPLLGHSGHIYLDIPQMVLIWVCMLGHLYRSCCKSFVEIRATLAMHALTYTTLSYFYQTSPILTKTGYVKGWYP